MGYSQGLETVVEAWRQLSDLKDLRLMLVGDGQAREMLETELGDDPGVAMLPTQDRADLPELLAAADVGLAPLRHGMAGTSVPCKIFGIMAAGRHVIAAVDAGSDAVELIQKANCGSVIGPEDPAALAQAIRSLYENRKTAVKLGRNGRRYVEVVHSHQVTVDQYERMLLDVIQRHGA